MTTKLLARIEVRTSSWKGRVLKRSLVAAPRIGDGMRLDGVQSIVTEVLWTPDATEHDLVVLTEARHQVWVGEE